MDQSIQNLEERRKIIELHLDRLLEARHRLIQCAHTHPEDLESLISARKPPKKARTGVCKIILRALKKLGQPTFNELYDWLKKNEDAYRDVSPAIARNRLYVFYYQKLLKSIPPTKRQRFCRYMLTKKGRQSVAASQKPKSR